MTEDPGELTRILKGGDAQRGELLPLVYGELKGIAANRMRGERGEHTLQATALVHEAWMRLAGNESIEWRDRRHFYGAAAEAMRRVLIDHARKARSEKRGGDLERVTLGAPEAASDFDAAELIALDEALDRLESEDARAATVVRLRFFAGLTMPEVALSMEVSERSAHREWAFARARLFELLEDS
ncbi:MAG: sigma-70 family RNA polymerase sigma factor [Planctomycetes bacterium]|nr:sigma-70 family RNA polymerase sigma factor [Planctomycetota bacterium]